MTQSTRYLIFSIVLILIIGSVVVIESYRPDIQVIREIAKIDPVGMDIEEKKNKYDVAKEIVLPSGFINTDEIKISELVGKKVILLDFMTYSCINCQRTWPYVQAWHEKYADHGLQIIGIHTPEFAFEKEYDNVVAAMKEYGLNFPIVLDNDYATWNVYNNRFWPAKYLIDIDGFVVYTHFGEGNYEETELKIQELLAERFERLSIEEKIEEFTLSTVESYDVDFSKVKSPEIYFGAWRNDDLSNGQSGVSGEQTFEKPETPYKNDLNLDGKWNIEREFAENLTGDASIVFKYEAKNVYMVAKAEEPVLIEIFQDGEKVNEITVQEESLYHLIEGEDYGEHDMEIRIGEPGLQAFTFTFG